MGKIGDAGVAEAKEGEEEDTIPLPILATEIFLWLFVFAIATGSSYHLVLGTHAVARKSLQGEMAETNGTRSVAGQAAVAAVAPAADDTNDTDDTDPNDPLFQPPPPREECPICTLPNPLGEETSAYMYCCGQVLCSGCIHENLRIIAATNGKRSEEATRSDRPPKLLDCCCPFCRVPMPRNDNEVIDRLRKRMELGDARAYYNMSAGYRKGSFGLKRSERMYFKHAKRAAELGSMQAYFNMALDYRSGKLCKKDKAKEREYFEIAAKGGHVKARHMLGLMEHDAGNERLALKHWLMSAAMGYDNSLENVGIGFKVGKVTKKEYANALRAHQRSLAEMKSEERDRYDQMQLGSLHGQMG